MKSSVKFLLPTKRHLSEIELELAIANVSVEAKRNELVSRRT